MMSVKKILIIQDNHALRQSLVALLEIDREFIVDQVDHAASALTRLNDAQYDIILLDLPDMDGRELCRLLRQSGVGIPIIMLTTTETQDDAILNLDAGAYDSIIKPFYFGVLLARLRAQLRQYEKSDEASLIIGPYRFQPGAKLLFDSEGQSKIYLTEKETAILRLLYRAEGGFVDRQTMLNTIWGHSNQVDTRTLETHIYRLRQKIETTPSRKKMILTRQGAYCLPVESKETLNISDD